MTGEEILVRLAEVIRERDRTAEFKLVSLEQLADLVEEAAADVALREHEERMDDD